MSRRRVKDKLYGQLALIGKAVGNSSRLELLEILAQGERTVEKLACETALSVANASHHLQVLRRAGLVVSRKSGLYVFYRLTNPGIYDLSLLIRDIAERHLAEVGRIVETFFEARDEFEAVGQGDLLELARTGAVVVLDVRPQDEFRAGHIPGAVSVPVEELAKRISELPAGKKIVAYCRGPYCVLAFRAVEILRASGRNARRLADGFPEWRAAGFPIEVSVTEEEAA